MPRTKTRIAATPAPMTHDVKTRIDAELHKKVVERARQEDRSEAAIVRLALREYLGAGS